ncbi:dihydrofolate reductase family protein [Candidatus Woesearchaeota archaeon]|nr:dihydrofolate reductase family protein [Candidatus Woesearchaeota archaeon]
MKVILFMAQTVNGYIARRNYGEDFLSHEHWNNFVSLAEKIGCVIIGRKTHEVVRKWKEYNFSSVNALKIVVSARSVRHLEPGFTFASSPRDALRDASRLGFRKVLLTGGGKLNSAFMNLKLIDELVLNIEPYLLGEGIPLFSEKRWEQKLKLLAVKKLSDGIVQLRYKVLN